MKFLFPLLTLVMFTNPLFQENKVFGYEETWGGAFALQATVGKSFGVNLYEHTKSTGKYSLILAPKWLRLTENGILFGTPQRSDAGEQEVYFSVTENGKENSFKIILTVLESAPITTREYNVNINEVFKVDLQDATGLKGRYEYTGAPKWLRLLDSGLIVGMAEESDIGVVIFNVKVTSELVNETFQVKLTVKKAESNLNPPPNHETKGMIPLETYVNEGFSINLVDMFHSEGNYTVTTSSWLHFDNASKKLSGTPSHNDVGIHEVHVSVEKPGSLEMGSFYVRVSKH